jgi:hypothetical protein
MIPRIVKPRNTKRRCTQDLPRPILEDKGTYGFIQRVPTWLREENDPEIGRSQNPVEVGGLHQVVSECPFFVCRLQAKEEKKETENLELYSVCDR